MLSLIRTPFHNVAVARLRYQNTDVRKLTNYNIGVALPNLRVKQLSVTCSNLTPWEPTPLIYSPTDEAEETEYKEETPKIFETLKYADTTETQAIESEKITQKSSSPSKKTAGFLKWPLWVLGPAFLLVTGMVPTLWLPISSIFLGPNIASLLSLVGLDCIFNIGAMLFLLMAHSTTQPRDPTEAPKSRVPFSYQFWNMFASLIGYAIPLALFFAEADPP